MKKHTLLKYLILGSLATLITTFLLPKKQAETLQVDKLRDYPSIQQEGVLRVATEYNSISYHISQDSLSGFHYELIKEFAHDHGLQLEITPEMSFEEQMNGLTQGKYDVIANSVLVTSELRDSVLLTHPLVLNKEVLVQRKPQSAADSAIFIQSQLDLAGKTLHITKGSPAILRLNNLGNEIADTIYIKEVEKYGPEQLIAMVAHGDIDYAVCNESTARAALDSLPMLDIRTAISFKQFYSWAINKHSPILLDSLNTWLEVYVKSKKYRLLHKRYFSY